MAFTILLSSAGRRVSLLRSLREAIAATGQAGRVIACDMGEMAPAMHVADAGFVVPACTDPGFPARVLGLCERERVDLVVPTIDPELPIWAALKSRLAEVGTAVGVSESEAVAIAADKRRTHDHCTAIGVPCPRQGTVNNVRHDAGGWTLPLIVKPATGSASVGLQVVNSWADFAEIADRDELVVEERAAGDEYTVDVYVDRRGVVHCPVVRHRLEVRAGEVSKARVVRDGHLASLAVKTVETLPGAFGPLNVQIFSDGQDASVIEINARFGGGYPLTWQAGGRYGEWMVREVAFGETPPADPRVDHDLTMLRWHQEVFVRGV